MNKRSIKYRDTWAAPGSDLFAALEAGDKQKAESIYQACEARLRLEQLPPVRSYAEYGAILKNPAATVLKRAVI